MQHLLVPAANVPLDSLRNDPDGDGIRSDAGRCPKKKETNDDPQDDDGCPDRLTGTRSNCTVQPARRQSTSCWDEVEVKGARS